MNGRSSCLLAGSRLAKAKERPRVPAGNGRQLLPVAPLLPVATRWLGVPPARPPPEGSALLRPLQVPPAAAQQRAFARAKRRPRRPRAIAPPVANRILRPSYLRPTTQAAQGPEPATTLLLVDLPRRQTTLWLLPAPPPTRSIALTSPSRMHGRPPCEKPARRNTKRPVCPWRGNRNRDAAHKEQRCGRVPAEGGSGRGRRS